MVFGFNTDVRFGDTVYHVQSEARKNERLLQTQVFVRGRCIGKQAISYAEQTEQEGFAEEQLHEMLKERHRHFVEAVRQGRIEAELGIAASAATAASQAGATIVVSPPAKAAPFSIDDLPVASDAELPEEARGAPGAGAAEPDGAKATPKISMQAVSGIVGKGVSLDCLPPSLAPDGSGALVCVRVTEGETPAAGAQLTCRISSGPGPAVYTYATTGATGIADLKVPLTATGEVGLLIQASFRGKSASRKYMIRVAG